MIESCWRYAFGIALALVRVPAAGAALPDAPHCVFQVHSMDAPNLLTSADQAIEAWRAGLKRDGNDPAVRQAMADYAINLMQRANRLDATGHDEQARSLRSYVLLRLPDTAWRVKHLAAQGDLGAIEARLAWLRSDPAHDAAELCVLAGRGAKLDGAESSYRLALCTTAAPEALEHMQRAAALGHPAALETIGKLCLTGRLSGACALDGLCRAAQAGRIGAAAAIGWRITDAHQPVSSDGAAWLQRAADAGDALAQNNLGEWHERQNTTAGGMKLALMWYRRAAVKGLPAAMVNAARLLAPGDAEQCKEAQSLLEQASRAGLTQAVDWRKELGCAR
ncbi:MAG: hypothetical protein SGI99_05995 [Pseudomonadota bacterium]|nr:hypothetical protein [Pseudomonadota bacterium]